ncbi:MAG: glucose-6-phosphate isomerase [Saprospiraceae bacterium]|nr:glucose-6-phosphate isomerase [Saprospiraceae bacterium]
MLNNQSPKDTKAWKQLAEHKKELEGSHLREMFQDDPHRVERFTLETNELFLDYSKNLITNKTIGLLVDLAEEMGVPEGIKGMFSGEKINETEGRAVLHVALRDRSQSHRLVDGVDVAKEVQAVLDRMQSFADKIENGNWKGYTGKKIRDVVNIGIGGSDLGVLMVTNALTPYHIKDRTVHFVSNVDGAHIKQTLEGLNPETTLFIIASKSFTTLETMSNAHSARRWFLSNGGSENDIRKHFVAVSTNQQLVTQFGIDEVNMFGFWDWVGGRYSLSSAVGLSVILAVGYDRFLELLEGMHLIDNHFAATPLATNMPVVLALIGIWYGNFWGAETEAVLPYAQNLEYLPAYLQQASMESNGKSMGRDGELVDYQTGAILWGGQGTNSQHSFFQLLHQGTQLIPCDFIIVANPDHELEGHHRILVANAIAQTEALMIGKTEQQARSELEKKGHTHATIDRLTPFRIFEGNRPSNSIMIRKLTPRALGSLIALYEHKIFVQGLIWNVYSFDQFGVELGKVLAKSIEEELAKTSEVRSHDNSTLALIEQYKVWQEKE